MKTKILYVLCLILNISLLLSCSDAEIEKVMPEAKSSFLDYNLKLEKKIDAKTFGTSDFVPQGSFVSNGKIYVTNYSENRVEILDFKTGKPVGFIKDWTFNGTAESLVNPSDVCVSGGRIYVSSYENYRVDVFDEKTLAFISCIGNGNWYGWSSMDAPYAVRVSGNKVFVINRHYEGLVKVFNADEVNTSTYKAMEAKAFLSLELQEGQWDAAFSMECNGDLLYVADRVNQRILVYEMKSIDLKNKELANKSNAIKPTAIINLKDKGALPTGITFLKDHMLVSYANASRIDVLNKLDGSALTYFKTIGGTALKRPDRIFAKNDTLFVSDVDNKAFFISTIHESVVKEFK